MTRADGLQLDWDGWTVLDRACEDLLALASNSSKCGFFFSLSLSLSAQPLREKDAFPVIPPHASTGPR